MPPRLLSLLMLLCLLAMGCGEDRVVVNAGGGGPNPQPAPQPTVATATILVRSNLARAVPAEVTHLRFLGYDENEALVFGAERREKAAEISLTVPVAVRTFVIELLRGNTIVGVFQTSVSLTEGQTLVIEDYAWVDVLVAGTPVAVAFQVQPAAGQPNVAITPPVQVAIVDPDGNPVTSAANPITVRLSTNPTGAALRGTLTVEPVNGVATFSDLAVGSAGTGYVLGAATTGLRSADSAPFDVVVQPLTTNRQSTAVSTLVSGGATASADFNADGLGDAAASGPFATDTSVLLRQADGTYRVTPLGAGRSDLMYTGDVNGDGRADILGIRGGAQAQLTILHGNGDGTFGPPSATALPAIPAGILPALALGDLTGDGLPDLAAAAGNDVLVLENAGGTFPAFASFNFAQTVTAVGVGNLNGGPPDVLASTTDFAASGDLQVLSDYNPNTNAFGATAAVAVGAVGPRAVVVADFDGATGPDVCVACRDNLFGGVSGLVLLVNDGTGGLAAQALIPSSELDQTPDSFAATNLQSADLNGDGRPDLALVSDAAGVDLFLNTGVAPFLAQQPGSPAGTNPFTLSILDVDADGLLDLAVGDLGSSHLVVSLGRGGAAFGPTLVSRAQRYQSNAVADFNGDSRPDLLGVALDPTFTVTGLDLFLQQADGSFPNVPSLQFPLPPPANILDMAAADFDGDGDPDVAVTDDNANQVVFLRNDGAGNLANAGAVPTGRIPFRLAVADFNRDGRPDLAVSLPFPFPDGQAAVLLNQGGFTFGVQTTASTTGGAIAAGDCDGDGNPDLVQPSFEGYVVLLGDGTGAFPRVRFQPFNSFGIGVNEVLLSDFNLDGLADAASGLDFSAGILVGLSDGQGQFSLSGVFSSLLGVFASRAAAGDLNGDGVPDLIAPNQFGGLCALLLGSGNGQFTDGVGLLTGGSPIQATVADLNGDGRNEVVVSCQDARTAAGLTILRP
ncbi:MAG: VCBS repeat-containing protein [Candidatus Eremiobacterota bacterium]